LPAWVKKSATGCTQRGEGKKGRRGEKWPNAGPQRKKKNGRSPLFFKALAFVLKSHFDGGRKSGRKETKDFRAVAGEQAYPRLT